MKCRSLKRLNCVLCVLCLFFASMACRVAGAEDSTLPMSTVSSVTAKPGFSFSIEVYMDGEVDVRSVQIGIDVITVDTNDVIHVQIDSITTEPTVLSTIGENTVTIMDPNCFASGYVCTLNLIIDQYENAGDAFLLELYRMEEGDKLPFGQCKVQVSPIKKGDTVIFGQYEQDANFANGKEPVSWLVLDVQEDRVLVISELVLDHVDYYPTQYATTWEKSYVRNWLNSTFINTAFSATEQSRVAEVTVEPHRNPYYNSESSLKSMGNATRDKVFLLDVVEAEMYFADNWARLAYSTEYAKKQNVSFDPESLCSNWMLRQPGNYGTTTACIDFLGRTNDGCVNVSAARTGIRPAMWILLSPAVE